MAEGKRAGKTTSQKVGTGLGKVADGMNEVRRRAAPLIWIVFGLLAAVLVVGALLIALDANTSNSGVEFVLNTADSLDLGIFSRTDGIFTFDGENAESKAALVNWGLAALVYVVVGKVLQRIMEP